jgi:signal peptidase I
MTRYLLARIAATALVGAALAAGGGYLAGFRLAAVTSGSMAPAIRTGDAVVIRTGGTPSTGDVVTFRSGAAGRLVSHRVVAVTTVGGERALTTRGDANDSTDPSPVGRGQVYGTVVARVPAFGRIAAFGTGTAGRLVAGLVLVVVLSPELAALAGGRAARSRRGRHRRREFRRSPALRPLTRVEWP